MIKLENDPQEICGEVNKEGKSSSEENDDKVEKPLLRENNHAVYVLLVSVVMVQLLNLFIYGLNLTTVAVFIFSLIVVIPAVWWISLDEE